MKYKVFKVVKRADLPRGAKVISTTWATMKKSNGKLSGQLNVCGFEHLDGQHYSSDSVSSPVKSCIIFT